MRSRKMYATTLGFVLLSACIQTNKIVGDAPIRLKSFGEVRDTWFKPPANASDMLERLKNPEESEQGAEALRIMAKTRYVTWATQELGESLNSSNSTVSMRCSGALTREYQRTNQWSKVDGLLVHPNPSVRAGATFELEELSREGIDISPVEKTLTRALADSKIGKYGIARDGQLAAITLAVHYTAKNQPDNLKSVLVGKNPQVFQSILESLIYAAKVNEKFDISPALPILYEFLPFTREGAKSTLIKTLVFGYLKIKQEQKARALLEYKDSSGKADEEAQRLATEFLEQAGIKIKKEN